MSDIDTPDFKPFIITRIDVFRDIKDPTAIALYGALLTYANNDKVCHPSLSVLSKDIGLSDKNLKPIRRALTILEEKGYVRKFKRWRNDEGETSREKTDVFRIPTSNGYHVYTEFRGAQYANHPSAHYAPTPSAHYAPRTISIELEPNELEKYPSISPSADCALPSEGDPQAGTPTHANHGTLQPVNESDPKGRKQGQGKSSKRQLDEEFERFWALVGRKRGKQQARKSFEKQRRTHDLEFICSQLMKAQAEWIRTGREPEYWPHPSTWLNQQLDDDYDTTSVPPNMSSTRLGCRCSENSMFGRKRSSTPLQVMRLCPPSPPPALKMMTRTRTTMTGIGARSHESLYRR